MSRSEVLSQTYNPLEPGEVNIKVSELHPGIFAVEVERNPLLPPISEEAKDYFLKRAETGELRYFLEEIISIVNKKVFLTTEGRPNH